MITLALALALVGPAPLQTEDPLAPARSGHLQCHAPDTRAKTCAAVARYSFSGGTIRNQAEVLLNPYPLITMHDQSPVEVRDGAVCGPIGGLEDAVFTIDGQQADPEVAERIRTQVTAAYAQLGTEVCTRYTQTDEGWLGEVVVDGRPRPDLNQTVIWISPWEGYTVRR